MLASATAGVASKAGGKNAAEGHCRRWSGSDSHRYNQCAKSVTCEHHANQNQGRKTARRLYRWAAVKESSYRLTKAGIREFVSVGVT